MAKSLSIITINYNNADGLRKTIESVVHQTYSDFEYIIIDGGSTDGSVEVLSGYEERLSFWVSEPDKGIYNAMNKGLKVAAGDYVLFMNSGDFLYDESVVETVFKTISPNDDLVYGDVVLKNEIIDSERIQTHPEQLPFSYLYKQTICQQSCFIKRALFDEIFYFNEDYKISADWEFLIYAIYIQKIRYRKINKLISVYDMTGVSSTQKFRAIARNERENTIETYFPLFKDDYKNLQSYSSNRFAQLKEIEGSVFLRKLVSIIFKALLIFMPKKKN